MNTRHLFFISSILFLVQPTFASAGMPSNLPIDVQRYTRLNDWSLERIQTISFFLLAFFLCAGLVKLLWNYLRRDFQWLPRLTYTKAVAGVLLWGLLFVVVLTMISGARELMTPGAWKRKGSTYELVDEPKPESDVDLESARRQHLEKLRTALWQFAATHDGRFPDAKETTAISSDLWEVRGFGGTQYLYRDSQRANRLPEVLVAEPELVTDRRLVLQTNGDIVIMPSAAIRAAFGKGGPSP